MGQRDGFSDFDVEKLNKMYDCGYGGASAPAPGATGGQGIDNTLVNSFVSGILTGLGFGDEKSS